MLALMGVCAHGMPLLNDVSDNDIFLLGWDNHVQFLPFQYCHGILLLFVMELV